MANHSQEQERDAASLPTPALKKTASSLLPAFEPLSSSPALPRSLKRTREALEEQPSYPTPVPTSSTAILSSSPTRANAVNPTAPRPVSTQSERAPLASVPSIQIHGDGQPVRLGRSSISCDLQLAANRAISRVHVLAWYRPSASAMQHDRLFIKCIGWNPITVHAGGKMFDLRKDQDFSTDVRDTDILLDVQGSRVRMHWPDKPQLGPNSSDEDQPSPSKRPRAMLRHSTPPSPSPAQMRRRPVSPISPSPAVQAVLPSSPPLPSRDPPVDPRTTPPVDIYEDPEPEEHIGEPASTADPSQAATHILTQTQNNSMKSVDSFASPGAAYSDNDEENDPIIISFGPSGDNLLPKMQSFNTGSPLARIKSPKVIKSPSHTDSAIRKDSPAQSKLPPTFSTPQSASFDIKDHVINQLAYSRLSSTPLSTILGNLPRDAGTISKSVLQDIVDDIPCVGEVSREGKDAAGKPLESEYYYVPEEDQDEKRKDAVVTDLMKPGLRSCRKQHKVSLRRRHLSSTLTFS